MTAERLAAVQFLEVVITGTDDDKTAAMAAYIVDHGGEAFLDAMFWIIGALGDVVCAELDITPTEMLHQLRHQAHDAGMSFAGPAGCDADGIV